MTLELGNVEFKPAISRSARALLSYWLEIRGEATVPDAADLRLEALEGNAATAIYSRWNEAREVIIQFCGNDLAITLGMDMTGKDLLGFAHPKLKETSAQFLERVGDWPCGAVSVLTLRGLSGPPREFEFLYLPVSSGGRNSCIIEMASPMDLDIRIGDLEGATQALRYHQPFFIDIGAGTPPAEGALAGIEKAEVSLLVDH